MYCSKVVTALEVIVCAKRCVYMKETMMMMSMVNCNLVKHYLKTIAKWNEHNTLFEECNLII